MMPRHSSGVTSTIRISPTETLHITTSTSSSLSTLRLRASSASPPPNAYSSGSS